MTSFASRLWVGWPSLFVLAALLALTACEATPSSSPPPEGPGTTGPLQSCILSSDRLVDSGVARDGIPALTDPSLVEANDDQADYLSDSSRVIGLLRSDTALAVPHNILWRHEIINLNDWGGRDLAVTYCPLTGSSLVFDREAVDGAEFGVSGLLFDNNLVMFDRRTQESIWPQMSRDALCGRAVGTDLEMVPAIEMRWDEWSALHPDTKVVSSETGHGFLYTDRSYPYGNYNRRDNDRLLFDGTPIDERRPPKERILGLPSNRRGIAFPFGELEESPVRVIERTVGNEQMVVFWSREARAAMAFKTSASFAVEGGRIVDEATGSAWTIEGRAVRGPRTGEALEPVEEAYTAFWFAWAVFQPGTTIWTSGS